MGLREKKSSLKNSKYIPDTQGGGSSGLPYIKLALPEDSPAGEYLAGIARTSADFPLRGGMYSTVASTEDTIRVSRFLTDFPKGALFTSKQIGLQKSNPRIETGTLGGRLNTQTYNLNANLLAQVAEQGTGIHINRAGFNTNELADDKNKYAYVVSHKSTNNNRLVSLYNSKIAFNLLDSDPVFDTFGISDDYTGLFNYAGGPGSLYGDGNTYITRVVHTIDGWEDYKEGGYSNSNYTPKDPLIYNALFEGEDPTKFQTLASGKFNTLLRKKFPRKFEQISTSEEIMDYTVDENNNITSTGTGEFQDVYLKQEILDENYLDNLIQNEDTSAQQGGTAISGDFIRPENSPAGISLINQFNSSMGYSQLLSAKDNNMATYQLKDFRQKTNSPQSRNYNDDLIDISTRIGIGNPGARTNAHRKGTNDVNFRNGQDKVNMMALYRDTLDPFAGKKNARDLIKFAFEVIDNTSPKNTTKIHFRAFLTDFADNISADWSSQKYMGRGENLYTYQGVGRQVSFQFKVFAQSKQEMLPLYQKLNFLASSLYPDYNDDGFMRGNLHKLTIGEYFYRTPGILTSMNISVDNDYSWEIKYSEPESGVRSDSNGNQTKGKKFTGDDFPVVSHVGNSDGSEDFQASNSDADMMELPQLLNVSVTFIPILNELPSLAKINNEYTRTKGILISNDVGGDENFINRVVDGLKKPPQTELDPDIPPINTDNN